MLGEVSQIYFKIDRKLVNYANCSSWFYGIVMALSSTIPAYEVGGIDKLYWYHIVTSTISLNISFIETTLCPPLAKSWRIGSELTFLHPNTWIRDKTHSKTIVDAGHLHTDRTYWGSRERHTLTWEITVLALNVHCFWTLAFLRRLDDFLSLLWSKLIVPGVSSSSLLESSRDEFILSEASIIAAFASSVSRRSSQAKSSMPRRSDVLHHNIVIDKPSYHIAIAFMTCTKDSRGLLLCHSILQPIAMIGIRHSLTFRLIPSIHIFSHNIEAFSYDLHSLIVINIINNEA